MNLVWTKPALKDAVRLYEFIASDSPVIAASVLERIRAGVARLSQFPQLGERVDRYEPREVRRMFIRPYEVRYEVAGDTVRIVRLWRARENR
jgi:plasmid stabilization system protein ParE